jgi:hypothetical protein
MKSQLKYNNSGGTITPKELGMYTCGNSNSPTSSTRGMVSRTLINGITGIDVEALDSIEVSVTYKVTTV